MNNITLPYSDTLSVDFTDEAWFNATEIAKNFGKKTNEWLRLDSTKEYISCLEQMLPKRENPASIKNQFVRTEKGGNNGGGCSWFHPKIAIAFARWLDVRFAIWCDMQIEKILHPVQYGLKQRPLWLYSITDAGHQRYQPIDSDCLCMTEEHFIRHLKNSGHIVVKKDKINVGNLVLEHIPYKLLPYMVEVAAQRIGRVEAGKSQA